MVERRKELDARYSRKKKMRKLKAKLVLPGADRAAILAKIKRLSPWWTEASLEQGSTTVATNTAEVKRKAPSNKPAGSKKG